MRQLLGIVGFELAFEYLSRRDSRQLLVAHAGISQERQAYSARLILLDLMMPVMDGFDFLMEMRARPEWETIPVIVVTAKNLSDADRNLLSGKVAQVLEKGAYTRDELIRLVRNLVAEGTAANSKS